MVEPKARAKATRSPRGPGRDPLPETIRWKVSKSYKRWLATAARKLEGTEADVCREAIRCYARQQQLRDPPLR